MDNQQCPALHRPWHHIACAANKQLDNASCVCSYATCDVTLLSHNAGTGMLYSTYLQRPHCNSFAQLLLYGQFMATASDQDSQQSDALPLQPASLVQNIHHHHHHSGFRAWLLAQQCSVREHKHNKQ